MEKPNKKIDYEIYCLYHNKVHREYYGPQIEKITFVKMGTSPYFFKGKKNILLSRTPYFRAIGKEWAEYELYYSIYKGYKEGMIKLPEYMGFIQYDMEFMAISGKYAGMTIMDFIEMLIRQNKLNSRTLIYFQPWSFKSLYEQHYIMDPSRPNITQDPLFENCMETIIKEYNLLTKSHLTCEDFADKNLPVCGSFFVHKSVFIKIMSLLSKIIEDRRLEIYDRQKRVQGYLSERYLAVFIEGLNLNKIEFPLIHHFKASISYEKRYTPTFKRGEFIIFNFMGKIGKIMQNRFPQAYNFLKPYFSYKG